MAAVRSALEVGYRHTDTAASYGHEREVGDTITRSGIARDEVFIETKVWISDHGHDETLHAFDKRAGKLGVDPRSRLWSPGATPNSWSVPCVWRDATGWPRANSYWMGCRSRAIR